MYGIGLVFLGMTKESQATKVKIAKWNYINFKASAQQRKTQKKESVIFTYGFAFHCSFFQEMC